MLQITRFGVGQTAKVCAVLYFVVSLVILVPIALFMAVAGSASAMPMPFGGGWVVLLVLPFVYAIVGFVGVALSCLLYNLVASRVGGIEMEMGGRVPGATAQSS